MRVALDTNVLVAAFATRGLCADLVRVVLAEHELVFPPAVRTELRRVLAKKIGLYRFTLSKHNPTPTMKTAQNFSSTTAATFAWLWPRTIFAPLRLR